MVLTLPPFTRVPTQAPIEDVVAEPAGRPLLEAAQVHLFKFLIISTTCNTAQTDDGGKNCLHPKDCRPDPLIL